MPATPDPLNPLLLCNQLCFALYSAQHAMTRVYRPLLEAMGLTYPQYLVMLLLWEQDGRSVKALGDQLGLDSGTLTPLLKRMEAQDFLHRSRDPADERVVRVNLSDKGRALQQQAACIPTQVAAATGLSLTELITLREELKRLRAALDRSANS